MSLSVRLRHAFAGFDLDAAFEAPPGVTVLFGRSGSGKSTIVNAVAGLLRPDAGEIRVDGRTLLDTARGVRLPPHRRRIGCVFQEARLFPHLTVRQNLLYGRWFAPKAPPSDAPPESPERIVAMLGLGPLLDRRPGALSGGEKQRVAIGRALLSNPTMILADEPLAALDDARKAEILPYFERLRDELGLPILYVCHSVAEAARLATTVVALRDGRIVKTGAAAEVFSDPETAPALGVREAGSILTGRVTRRCADGLAEVAISGGVMVVPDSGIEAGAALRMRIEAHEVTLAMVRPERISALNVLEGTVTALQPGRGPGMIVRLAVGEDHLLARITRRSGAALGLAPGDRCFAIVKSVAVAPISVGRDIDAAREPERGGAPDPESA